MCGRQSALVFLLGLMLACWSVDATLITTVMHHKSKQHRNAERSENAVADGRTFDDEDNEDGEDDHDDDDDEHDDNEGADDYNDDDQAAGPKEVPAALPQIAETTMAPPSAASPPKLLAPPSQVAKTGVAPARLAKKEVAMAEQAPAHKNHMHLELKPVALSQVANSAGGGLGQNIRMSPAGLGERELQLAEEALADNKQTQLELKQRIAHLSDSKSGEEIDALAMLVANQTESVAMAEMIASLWKEMRMFEVPFYAEHVQEEVHRLKHEQLSLEAEVAAAKQQEAKDEKTAEEEEAAEEEEEEKREAQKTEQAMNVEAEGEQETGIDRTQPANLFWPAVVHGANGAHAGVKKNAYMNFWAMSPKRQESFLGGSLVYLVAGICLAYLHNSVRSRSSKFFAAAPREQQRGTKHFSFSLFDCFSVPNVCLIGCCCPCLRWADTTDRTGLFPYMKAFFVFFTLTLLYSFTWGIAPLLLIALGVVYRQKLRKHYDLENGTASSVAHDVLAWTCCQPCAIIQEAREESLKESAEDP